MLVLGTREAVAGRDKATRILRLAGGLSAGLDGLQETLLRSRLTLELRIGRTLGLALVG